MAADIIYGIKSQQPLIFSTITYTFLESLYWTFGIDYFIHSHIFSHVVTLIIPLAKPHQLRRYTSVEIALCNLTLPQTTV